MIYDGYEKICYKKTLKVKQLCHELKEGDEVASSFNGESLNEYGYYGVTTYKKTTIKDGPPYESYNRVLKVLSVDEFVLAIGSFDFYCHFSSMNEIAFNIALAASREISAQEAYLNIAHYLIQNNHSLLKPGLTEQISTVFHVKGDTTKPI